MHEASGSVAAVATGTSSITIHTASLDATFALPAATTLAAAVAALAATAPATTAIAAAFALATKRAGSACIATLLGSRRA